MQEQAAFHGKLSNADSNANHQWLKASGPSMLRLLILTIAEVVKTFGETRGRSKLLTSSATSKLDVDGPLVRTLFAPQRANLTLRCRTGRPASSFHAGRSASKMTDGAGNEESEEQPAARIKV